MLLDKYRHLRKLCQENGIKVCGIDDVMESAAYHDKVRGVVFPPPRTIGDYMAALHEVGHYVAPGGVGHSGGDERILWKQEVLASRWALANAEDLTDEGIDFLAEALHTYSVGFGLEHDVSGCRAILTEKEAK